MVGYDSTSSKSGPRRYLKMSAALKIDDNGKFLENFNPETSAREKRKLSRKINQQPSPVPRRAPAGALYDRDGVTIASKSDLCDCLNRACRGCWFPCPKCGSNKCGPECRVHRKFMYDQIEYHGYDIITKAPLSRG